MLPVEPKILTVSQLNFYVKSVLDSDPRLNYVFLCGEISNLTDHYRSGHIYLSLKDNKSVIRAVMFAGNARNLKFKPMEGMKVICRGRVTLYEATGQYQYYIEDMQPDGIGALYQAYEQLKEKLQSKGLFDQSHKKPIPYCPKTIGVITSPTGAAVQDIKNILTRRFPSVNIILCPVLVQGDNAVPQLIDAVNKLNEYDLCDTIIIGRGGGSIEDLWAFNDENLAYAIYNSHIPVISAVGHETDFTICDFVSDLRAPTPSAGAELAVPDRNEILQNLDAQRQYLSSLMDKKLIENNNVVSEMTTKLLSLSPDDKIAKLYNDLDFLSQKYENNSNRIFQNTANKIELLATKLESLNPVSTLKRGYSVVTNNDKTVTSVKDVKNGDTLAINVTDGKIISKVIGE
ncbi:MULTISPECIES: exodeoxyribonuclease VII large subunit [Ruminococcus]|uniref:Exodeoxyribonuclease 7 large subunit n=1 Tax=Ruminococcus bovis TaxID=2564099 RepID=A0A4P8XYR1_9FIRM|nr:MULTISPECIES: exodeoxyribonuclease VII large subunit [Ruminococcus]QCT07902.1 exodeoxyribonuclease VII large subunit [Ruminococcus bovis]